MTEQTKMAILADFAKKEGMYLRRIIRRNKGEILTNSEVRVLVAMTNLWLYHRNGPKGFIHPGCDLLAKKAKVSRKTVSRALELFRKIGIADDIKHIKGGNGRATQYQLDTMKIQKLFDPSGVTELRGQIVPFSGTFAAQNVSLKAGQNVPLSKEVADATTLPMGNDTEGNSDD